MPAPFIAVTQAPRISVAGTRVFKAVTTASTTAKATDPETGLTSGQKLVWLETWVLDKGPGTDRAYISATNLARRLGMGADNVEKARRELKRAGLMGSAPRPGKREPSWWPILPSECIPSSERPSDDEVCKLAELLEGHIRFARSNGRADQSTATISRIPGDTGVLEDASADHDSGVLEGASLAIRAGVPQSGREGGEVGGEGASHLTSNLKRVGTTSPTSLPPSEPGSEVGSFASERDEGGPQSALNWRDILEPPPASRQPIPIRAMLGGARRE